MTGAENNPVSVAGKSTASSSMRVDADPVALHEAIVAGNIASRPTIRKLGFRKAKITVANIDEHAFTRGSIPKTLQKLCTLLEITSFASCDECVASNKHYDLIFYHVHESVVKCKSNNERLLPLKKVLPIAPVIILSDIESYDSICAAFDFGIRGYIPTATTTPEIAIEIMYLVKSGGTFVPPSGLSLRRSGLQEPCDPVIAQQFTPREIAVLDLLKLGKTNKIIAYRLQISESSVKSHIRNIMTKLNATNRTEVACRANELQRGSNEGG
jgi:DNA-binding NarL/FixJ family response regulator